MTETEKTPAAAVLPAAKLAIKPAAKSASNAAAKASAKSGKPAADKAATKAAPAGAKSATKPTTSKPVDSAVEVKAPKPKKIKMVRDSLSIPKLEYDVLDTLKLRAAKMGNPVKKTELIRAGIKAIASLPDSALLAAIQSVPSLKTGRPSKD